MRQLRILILLLACLGLSLQATALAAMPAAEEGIQASDCTEMAAHDSVAIADDPDGMKLPDCCKDMAFSCMMGMGCQSLVGLAEHDGNSSAFGSGDRSYLAFATKTLVANWGGPEPPPPQPFS